MLTFSFTNTSIYCIIDYQAEIIYKVKRTTIIMLMGIDKIQTHIVIMTITIRIQKEIATQGWIAM